MRKNFELKMGQQENYYLFTHKTGDAEQENQGENPTGTKEQNAELKIPALQHQ